MEGSGSKTNVIVFLLQAAYRHIDLEIPERLSGLAKEAGIVHCSTLTSTGSNANSWFLYLRTKGEVVFHNYIHLQYMCQILVGLKF